MMYTSSAASQVTGGATALQNLQRQRIVETNKVYADSGTRVDLILVGIQAVSAQPWACTLCSRTCWAPVAAVGTTSAWLPSC